MQIDSVNRMLLLFLVTLYKAAGRPDWHCVLSVGLLYRADTYGFFAMSVH